MAMIFGVQGVAVASSFTIDLGKARAASARVFALFDLEPKIDNLSEEGRELVRIVKRFSLLVNQSCTIYRKA
jgi:hypothetical protein